MKIQTRILIYYSLFGMAIIFAVSFLMLWMKHDITQPGPWAVVIGGLVGIAFKLFSDAVRREYGPGESKKISVAENQEKKSETIAPSDEK